MSIQVNKLNAIVFSFLLLAILIFSGLAYSSGNEISSNTKLPDEIYIETCHFHFKKVDSLILANDHLHKNDLSYNLAVINYYWWKLISGEENGKYAKLISSRVQTIENKYLKKNQNVDNEQLFSLISIFIFKVRVNLIDKSYFKAFKNYMKYHSFIKMSLGHEAEYNPFFLTSGLYYFFSGLTNERVPVLSPFPNVYFTGNMDIGIEYIKKAASSDYIEISREAQYFLMKIYFDVFKNYAEASIYCNKLISVYPENLLFQQYMFKNDLATGKLNRARSRIMLMEKLAKSNKQLTIDEAEYYIKHVRLEFSEYVEVHDY